MTTDQIGFFTDRFTTMGTAERAQGEKKYLKSEMKHFGVPVPGVRKAAVEFCKQNPDIGRADLLRLVKKLWASDWYEHKSVALALLERKVGLLVARDMDLLERLLDQCVTWAHVDWIAPHVAGSLVERYPTCNEKLDDWATHPNFWVRRASMLALLKPIRTTGEGFDQFSRYAASMLHEKEFFIRKAIGWILREASKKHPEITFDFLRRHIGEVSGLTFREGSKKLSTQMREDLAALR